MKISLFQAILLGVFSIGALMGLFVFATHTNNNSGGENDIGTVVIWGTLPKTSMDNVLSLAAQANEALKNLSYVQKSPSVLSSELASAIATGVAPDLILASQEELRSIAKYLSPIPLDMLSQATFTSTFIEEGDVFATNGGYYGIPFLVDPLVLFSNRDILSSAGIARPPATWEALTGLVPSVAQMTPARQITRGLIALGTYDNVRNARGILSSLFLQQSIPISSYNNGGLGANIGSNTSSGQSPGKAVVGFYTQFADPSKVSYTWNASLQSSDQMFLAGDLALYLGYASEARYMTQGNPNLNFAVTALPQPATAKFRNAYGLLYAFMIPRGAKNSSGAYQSAEFFTTPTAQISSASATGLAPSTLSQLASVPDDPVAVVAYAEALYSRGWLSPMPADTDRVFSGMIRDVISGRSSIDNALISAERSLTQLLQQ